MAAGVHEELHDRIHRFAGQSGVGMLLDEAAHSGLRWLTPRHVQRMREAACGLKDVGLASAAARVEEVAQTVHGLLEGGTAEAAAKAWCDACIRVMLLQETA